MKKKITIAVVCAVLSCVCLIGTTFAWLVDKTEPVKNTFTVGNVDITLTETGATLNGSVYENSFKMVPGNTITKDPKVTVIGGSEACWVFIKIEKSANFDTFMEYAVATGWTALAGNDGVYYREVAASAADQPFVVLADNEVTVKNTVTKAMMDEIVADASLKPTLTFTAYAVQRDNINTAAEAWTIANS